MAQLLDLQGNPLTWPRLNQMVTEYYTMQEANEAVERVCGPCKQGSHKVCTGWMSATGGRDGNSPHTKIPCPCLHLRVREAVA